MTIADPPTSAASTASSPDEKLERILASVGLQSAPMDPSSVMALKQMIAQRQHPPRQSTSFAGSAAEGHFLQKNPEGVAAAGYATAATVSANFGSRTASSGSALKSVLKTSSTLKTPPSYSESTTTNSSSSSSSSSSTSSSSAVLEQLKLQTSLLLDLQQKVQILTQKVERLETNGGIGRGSDKASLSSPSSSAASNIDSSDSSRSVKRNGKTPVTTIGDSTSNDETSPRLQLQELQQQQQPVPLLENELPQVPPPRQRGLLERILMVWWATPICWPVRYLILCLRFEIRIFREFHRKLRAEMRPLDGGIMFQLVFIGLVLSSRVSTSKQPEKFAVLCILVSVGFLYQLKFFHVFYRFFVKDNVPERVWRELTGAAPPAGNNNNPRAAGGGGPGGLPGERLPMGGINGGAAAAGEGQDGPNAVADAGLGLGGRPGRGNVDAAWRNMFVMGGIYQRQEDGVDAAARNPVLGMIWDIFYLFGSFVFSIFPMWNPQARGGQPAAEPQQQPAAAVAPGNAGVGAAAAGQGGGGQIPEVQAPPDAMEPVDDDDDED